VDIEELGMGGLVPRNLLKDDRYDFDSTRRQIRGRRSRRLIRVGDLVQVKIARVDSARQRVDFALAPSPARAQRR
jgi:exoribonuclease R